MKRRFITNRLLKLFENFPVVLLTGARQVGKTTLIRSLISDKAKVVTFDSVQDIGGARQDPDLFLQNVSFPTFLDEVQFAPELLASLKRKIDSLQGEKSLFWLSGSQNLSLLKNVAESMAGRVAIAELFPMSQRELAEKEQEGLLESWILRGKQNFTSSGGKVLSVYSAMWIGGMPGLIELENEVVSDYFQSYLQTYIERDVRLAANISNLQNFGRFIRLLAAYSAQEVNPHQIGRELNIDRKTAIHWLSICEATYQWLRIPAFSMNAVKRVSGKAKGYLTDSGFICALQSIPSPEALSNHPMKGHIFEGFVVMEILKRIQAWPTRPQMFHYRSHSGAEVDLILEYNGVLFPVEIKLTTKPNKHDCRGIHSFKSHFPQQKFGVGLMICSTEVPFAISKDVWAVPWWEL